jgi:hypothetical protein
LYVKICSLYGDGFYYIPGTDICLKLGGYVRSQVSYGTGNSATAGVFFNPNQPQTRIGTQVSDFVHRTRSLISVDTRQQTEWGTLRTYFTVGHSGDGPAAEALYVNRGFIQFAGFTLGLASSFFDFYSSPIVSYTAYPAEDTGDGGWRVLAYTANFGNGFTATVSLEDPRRLPVVNRAFSSANTTVATATAPSIAFNDPFIVGTVTADQAIVRYPDLVMNWRVDQAWGAAMIGGAITDPNGGYYGTSLLNVAQQGHPTDTIGWVATAGLRLNAPGGSYFQAQASVGEGAGRYLCHTQCGAPSSAAKFGIGNSLGLGYAIDGIYTTGSEVELTRGWAVYAAYDHLWTPKWRTSIYGGYVKMEFNPVAKALIAEATCGVAPIAGGTSAAPAAPAGSVTGMSNCDPDWAHGYIGTRTQYNFTPDFYAGIDISYSKLFTAFGGTANYRTNNARPSGVYTIEDQDNVAVVLRVHRDFKP